MAAAVKPGRGGKRPGAGRKPTGKVRVQMTLHPRTVAKIEKLRKATHVWRKKGEIVDDLMRKVSVKGAEYLDLARDL